MNEYENELNIETHKVEISKWNLAISTFHKSMYWHLYMLYKYSVNWSIFNGKIFPKTKFFSSLSLLSFNQKVERMVIFF